MHMRVAVVVAAMWIVAGWRGAVHVCAQGFLSQSILVVLPYLLTLLALTAVCFAAAYATFMRQEIRSI